MSSKIGSVKEAIRKALPKNHLLKGRVIKFKVPGEIFPLTVETALQEMEQEIRALNAYVWDYDVIYNDESFTSVTLSFRTNRSPEWMNDMFFLKKLFDDLNNMHGTVELEEQFKIVMGKLIAGNGKSY